MDSTKSLPPEPNQPKPYGPLDRLADLLLDRWLEERKLKREQDAHSFIHHDAHEIQLHTSQPSEHRQTSEGGR